jgi:homoserine kinase
MQQLSRFVNYNGGPFVSGAGPTAAVFSQSRLAHRAVQLNTENELPKHTKTAPVPEP